MLWVAAAYAAHTAYSVTPDAALLLLALLLGVGLVLLDAVRGMRLTSPLVLGCHAFGGGSARRATASPGPRPSRFLLSTFRC